MKWWIECALWCGRADWESFIDELTPREFHTINKLRSTTQLAHDGDFWRQMVQTFHIAASMAEINDPEGWLNNYEFMVTGRKPTTEQATPEQMARFARGNHR